MTRSLEAAIQLASFKTRKDFQDDRVANARQWADREEFEAALTQPAGARWTVLGFCFVCGTDTEFIVDWEAASSRTGVPVLNWRERMICPGCRLNARMRSVVHLIHEYVRPDPSSRIYLTEQVTDLAGILRGRYSNLVGSEYWAPEFTSGTIFGPGRRHEDLTCLSFEEASFDYVFSFDVLEHVPDHKKALAECRRVLAETGLLLFSTPMFLGEDKNVIRARLAESGGIIHDFPPIFHGNPIGRDGSLVFVDFGWELLADMRDAGFDAHLLVFWSDEFGYIGNHMLVIGYPA